MSLFAGHMQNAPAAYQIRFLQFTAHFCATCPAVPPRGRRMGMAMPHRNRPAGGPARHEVGQISPTPSREPLRSTPTPYRAPWLAPRIITEALFAASCNALLLR